MYEEGRQLYTAEVNAAVCGAKRAGASDIVVVDCHGAGGDWSFNSLRAPETAHFPDRLDVDCTWVAHHPWSRYTELLEQGAEGARDRPFACLLVGMHARNNTVDGVLCHTISTVKWHNLWFNDDLVGEVGVNAALCGHYGCPILLVTGDDAVCRESRALLGDELTNVAVKKGLTRYSARQIPPRGARDRPFRARQMIEDGAYQALQNLDAVQPYVPEAPVTITIEVDKGARDRPLGARDRPLVEKMDDFRGRPGVELDYARQTVHSRAANWMTAWGQIWH